MTIDIRSSEHKWVVAVPPRKRCTILSERRLYLPNGLINIIIIIKLSAARVTAVIVVKKWIGMQTLKCGRALLLIVVPMPFLSFKTNKYCPFGIGRRNGNSVRTIQSSIRLLRGAYGYTQGVSAASRIFGDRFVACGGKND